jgi:hypothetical protein
MHGVQVAVASDFVDKLATERDLDVPLMAMLGLLGYQNVALTHGPGEMGRDHIAQIGSGRQRRQWCFQAKKGSIGRSAWRSEVRPQLEEAIDAKFAHPMFDESLPRTIVLVITRELSSSVQPLFDGFASKCASLGVKVELWNRQVLIDKLARTKALASWQSWSLVGHSLHQIKSGRSGVEAIRAICQPWVTWNAASDSAFWSSFMSLALMESFLRSEGMGYLANRAACGMVSLIMAADARRSLTRESALCLLDGIGEHLVSQCIQKEGWRDLKLVGHGRISGPHVGTIYPLGVLAQMRMEDAGLGLAISRERSVPLSVSSKWLRVSLRELLAMGVCSRPPGENYAVSVLLGGLGLHLVSEDAGSYLERVADWVALSYGERAGLAPIGAGPLSEVMYVGPWRLDHSIARPHHASTIASAVLDLASVLGLGGVYQVCQKKFVGVPSLVPFKIIPDGSHEEFVGGGGYLVTGADYPPGWSPLDGWRNADSHSGLKSRWFDGEGRSWIGLAMASWFRDRWWLASTHDLIRRVAT